MTALARRGAIAARRRLTLSDYAALIAGYGSLVSHWRLGEASPGTGTATDQKAANHGTYVASPTGVPGLLLGDSVTDGAVAFNGTTQKITLPNNASTQLTQFTFEAWVVRGATGVFRHIYGRGAHNWLGLNSSGTVQIAFWDGSGYQQANSPSALSAGTTYHLAATYDALNLRLYINGAQIASSATSATPDTGGVPNIAYRADENDGWWNGTLDEVAVYNAALTAPEVLANYNAGIGA